MFSPARLLFSERCDFFGKGLRQARVWVAQIMIISRLVAKRILLLEINAVERLYNVLRKSHEQLIDINYNYP